MITPSGADTREESEIAVSAKGGHETGMNITVPEYTWPGRRFLTIR